MVSDESLGRDETYVCNASHNAMFDELAERSLMSPLAGTKHTYVRLAIIIYCQILALFFSSL